MDHQHGDNYGFAGGVILGVAGYLSATVEQHTMLDIPPILITTLGVIMNGAIGGAVGWAVKKAMDYLYDKFKTWNNDRISKKNQ